MVSARASAAVGIGTAPVSAAAAATTSEVPIRPARTAAAWILLYLALITAPLALLLIGERPRGGGVWWDFSLALGYASLAMMGVQFWLTARFRRATAPFGIDLVYYFHRHLATIAFVILLAHVLILRWRHPAALGDIDPRSAPAYMTLGRLALACFALLIVSSLWRKALRLSYDPWRRLHIVLAVAGVVFAVLHVLGSGSYLEVTWKRTAWVMLALSWLALAAWIRGLRPLRLLQQPWRVAEVRREPGRNWTLALTPESGRVFPFHAGQFAWLTLRASPFAMAEHPFSIASSPTRRDRIEFMIKELGDFTATIGSVQPGERAYVDGPYGSFGIDAHPHARGYVFIAGGAGIAPVISMLRTLADRGDRRRLVLFYGNRSLERAVFVDALADLAGRLDLGVVHVLTEPPADWAGERGFVDAGVMRRHLPEARGELHYFVCGPTPMIRLAEAALGELGVPLSQLHSEIFDLA